LLASKNYCGIVVNKKFILRTSDFLIIIQKIKLRNGKLTFIAFVKSAVYNYIDEAACVIASENDSEKRKLDTVLIAQSNYKSQTQTNRFWGFSYTCDVRQIHSVRFTVQLDGYEYETRFWGSKESGLDTDSGILSTIRDNICISLVDSGFTFSTVDKAAAALTLRKIAIPNKTELAFIKAFALKIKETERIWLYCDNESVLFDNAYTQFIHDFEKDDGVKRYYVYTRPFSDIESLFEEKHIPYLIKFGSDMHKKYYLAAEKLLTAFWGTASSSPFNLQSKEYLYITDIANAEVIYLQHGVLHANFRPSKWNSAFQGFADKVVVSSEFEFDIYQKQYNFLPENLIKTGMARYDSIDRSIKAKKRVLFAPSWRKYLVKNAGPASYSLDKSVLIESGYFQNILNFLASPGLQDLLENYDFELDVKLHPIMRFASDMMPMASTRVCFVEETISPGEYSVFITDISSLAFDFVYLKCAIMYFVPDINEFKVGRHSYRELHIPLEEGFGELTIDPDDAVAALRRILQRGCTPQEPYKSRMDGFFLHDGGENCERLYQVLMGGGEK
jgi:hypothetical protein